MAADLSSLQYVQDEQGDALLVSKEGWQVMMAWEKPYMEACVAALGLDPSSDVLEIGFGLGYSSNAIQLCGVRSHTIVDCAPEVLKRLRAWQADDGAGKPRAGVRVVDGLWQLRLPELGKFDAVFMDDYPVGSETFKAELHRRFPKYAEVYQGAPSKWEAFVDMCLNWHLRPGGRIGGYMVVPKYPRRPDCTAYMFPYEAVVSKVCKYVTNNQPVGFAAHRRAGRGGDPPLDHVPTAAPAPLSAGHVAGDDSGGASSSSSAAAAAAAASAAVSGGVAGKRPPPQGQGSVAQALAAVAGDSKPGSRPGSQSVVRTMVIPKIIFTPQNAAPQGASGSRAGSPSSAAVMAAAVKRKVFQSHPFDQTVVVSNADAAVAAFKRRKAAQARRKEEETQKEAELAVCAATVAAAASAVAAEASPRPSTSPPP